MVVSSEVGAFTSGKHLQTQGAPLSRGGGEGGNRTRLLDQVPEDYHDSVSYSWSRSLCLCHPGEGGEGGGAHLVGTKAEVSDSARHHMVHVGRLLLAVQGVLPDLRTKQSLTAD